MMTIHDETGCFKDDCKRFMETLMMIVHGHGALMLIVQETGSFNDGYTQDR